MKQSGENKTGANMPVTTTISAIYLRFSALPLQWLQATRYQ
jgi:hypothetical protein